MKGKFFVVAVVLTFFLFCDARRDGNQKLKTCCARQKEADKACKRRFCDFNALSQDNVLFFLNTCTPKGSTVQRMWECASSRRDHTKCCKEKKVIKECLQYCQADKGPPTDYVKHLFCLQAFNPIRDCFRSYLDSHPNIFADN